MRSGPPGWGAGQGPGERGSPLRPSKSGPKDRGQGVLVGESFAVPAPEVGATVALEGSGGGVGDRVEVGPPGGAVAVLVDGGGIEPVNCSRCCSANARVSGAAPGSCKIHCHRRMASLTLSGVVSENEAQSA